MPERIPIGETVTIGKSEYDGSSADMSPDLILEGGRGKIFAHRELDNLFYYDVKIIDPVSCRGEEFLFAPEEVSL